jgi:hypothetical protein
MADLQLVVVPAYYRRRDTGQVVEALPENRLLAEDMAPKWRRWRELAAARGWEILLNAPYPPGSYTRAMFRTPDDQATLRAELGTMAAVPDKGPHQAGRGIDVALEDMAELYADYEYSDLVAMARQAGIFNRVASEPWHFDDNPASIFGSTALAIEAVGNLTSQVAAAISAGLESPQVQAVRRWLEENKKLVATGALGLGLAVALGVAVVASTRRQQRARSMETAALAA